MQKEGLTPLSEVNKASDRVAIRLSLPAWLQSDSIGIHLPRVHRAMSWGGIRNVTFQGVSETRSAYAIPQSVMRDGAATAAIAKSQTMADDISNTLLTGRMTIRNAQRANVHIRVYLEKLREKIDREKGTIRNPEDWTKEFDATMRNGIRRGGLKHLFTGFENSQRGLSFIANIGTGAIGTGLLLSFHERYNPLGTDAFNKAIVAQLCNLIMFNATGSLSDGFEKNGRGYRINLFPGFELDRALALLASTRQSQPFIKPLDSHSK